MKKIDYILGLDLGVNSVGWAVVECETKMKTVTEKDKDGNSKIVTKPRYYPKRLVALNSRIFQTMLDDEEIPKNAGRRAHRSMRRGIARRRGRRDALIKYLKEVQLLPKKIDEGVPKKIDERVLNAIGKEFAERVEGHPNASEWQAQGSYPLFMRVFGLDAPLKPYEFGCVLLQLQKRRGYKSNHGAKYDDLHKKLGIKKVEETDPKKAQDKEEGKVLTGIRELKEQMKKIEARTISEYIYKQTKKGPLKRVTQHSFPVTKKDKKKSKTQDLSNGSEDESSTKEQIFRTFYGNREIYREEFDQLWNKQAISLKLKDKDKEKIENLIFYQRPLMYPVPREKTYYEPIDTSSGGRLSHLRYNDVGVCSIFPNQPRAAKALLDCQEYRTWQFISNIKISKDGSGEVILNTEQRQKIHKLVNSRDYISKYYNKPFDKQVEVIQDHLEETINFSKEGSSQRLGNKTAYDIAKEIGEDTWQAYDNKKKNQLVDDLLDIGDKVKLYDKLTEKWKFSEGRDGHAYKLATLELEQGHMKHCKEAVEAILARMRDQGKIYSDACNDLEYDVQASSQDKSSSSGKRKIFIPSVANPRVQKALFEIGRLLPAIIDKYGKPKVIRIELIRELKLSEKDRKKFIERQRKDRRNNLKAEERLQEEGIPNPSRDAIRKYKMLKQQSFGCMYCLRYLGRNPLQGNIEEDHILPLPIFWQNYNNTVLVCQTCNQDKRSQTPYEAWGQTDRWEYIKTNLALDEQEKRCLNYPDIPVSKIKRILRENYNRGDEGFVESQLRDTSYISKLTAKILSSGSGIDIQTTKGRATGVLRNLWGLKDVLSGPPNQNKETGKNRRDHRHHAIDAFIVAMTDHKMLLNLTKFTQKERELKYRHSKQIAEECMRHKQKISKPTLWTKSKSIHEEVKELVMNAVVSHQQPQNKIYGALHEESCYAKSCYRDPEAMDINTSKSTLRKLQEYLETDPEANGIITWILRTRERDTIKQWLGKIENLSKEEIKGFPLPKLNDKTLDKVVLAHRCYVIRKKLDKPLFKYAEQEWKPGTGHWIMDETVHKQLADWLKNHKNNIEEGLKDGPPRVNPKNGRGNPIKSVRIAKKFSAASIVEIRKGKIFKLGANHHVELFEFVDKNAETRGKREVKARFVSMLEAAQRRSRKEPIVNRVPDPIWDGEGWEFWMTLKINDMVLWDEKDERIKKHLNLGPSIYRVQKMSGTENTLDIHFRHYSIASSIDEHGLIRIQSTSNLNCRKISVDALGDHQE